MKNVGFGAYFCCSDRLNEKSVAILSQNGLILKRVFCKKHRDTEIVTYMNIFRKDLYEKFTKNLSGVKQFSVRYKRVVWT